MRKKNIIRISLLFFLLVALTIAFYFYPSLKIASGYAAKYACSYSFVSNLEYPKIQQSFNFFPVNKVECVIDTQQKTVTASLFGIAERKAYYYEKGNVCGCVLDSVNNINKLLSSIPAKKTGKNEELAWIASPDSFSSEVDMEKLNEVLRSAIDSNPATLAITVAFKNKLLAEHYTDGVNKDSRLLGWSMTKTLLNALFGILHKNGKIDLNAPCDIAEWKSDERKEITLNHLMQMSSGLQWTEDYSVKTDVTQMLYSEPDVSHFALSKNAEKKPGTEWYYSSGTTNILSHILRLNLADAYLNFPFDSLFYPIGMNSATLEMDNAGNYVLSSYGWATARDWTRFGLLYLNEGKWNDKEIFSAQWKNYSVNPVGCSKGQYGAQVWLNAADKKLNAVPDDGFFANGYGGQKILVIPSRQMVVVILSGRQKDFDFNSFYGKVLSCFN